MNDMAHKIKSSNDLPLVVMKKVSNEHFPEIPENEIGIANIHNVNKVSKRIGGEDKSKIVHKSIMKKKNKETIGEKGIIKKSFEDMD